MGNLYPCVFKLILYIVLYCLTNMHQVPYLEEYKKISATNKDWGSFLTDKVSNINLLDYNARQICHVATQWNRINEVVKKCLRKAPSDRPSTDECKQTVKKQISMKAYHLNIHQGTAICEAQEKAIKSNL